MDPGERVEVLIRKAYYSDRKELYYLTLSAKLENMDELFAHPDILDLIGKVWFAWNRSIVIVLNYLYQNSIHGAGGAVHCIHLYT
jgi:hypothetical protein